MLFIDLDDFKAVNDLYGHAAGDALLIALARRLVATVRPADTVARLGGDEFVVVCEDIDERTAIALGERLTEAIHEPLDVDGIEHRLSASIGIALGAAGRRDPDALLADADAAAYRAKAEGRGRVEVFDRRLRAHARERLRTAAALERALSLGQLRLAFQPIVSPRRPARRGARGAAALGQPGRRDVGAGGLHPGRRGVGADRRDRRVDADAGLPRDARRRSGGEADGPIVTSTSPAASSPSPTCRRWWRTACARAGCPRSRLRLELKERCCRARRRPRGATSRCCASSASGSRWTTSAPATRRCATCRCRRSRSTARSCALGRSAGDTAIVAAIVSLARALGIDAIAEGVENEAQATLLRELGCPHAQGYLFGAPGPRIISEP